MKIPSFGPLKASALTMALVAVLMSGCGSTAPTPTAPTDSSGPISVEVFLSRGSLNGTDFEQYKFNGPNLYYECGKIARGRYASQQQEFIAVNTETSTALSARLQDLHAIAERSPAPLDPPGKSNGMFDPGQATFAFTGSSGTKELRTSLDGIVNSASSVPGKLQRLAVALRGIPPASPCGNAEFYGLGR
jgi:hypothetical protein